MFRAAPQPDIANGNSNQEVNLTNVSLKDQTNENDTELKAGNAQQSDSTVAVEATEPNDSVVESMPFALAVG